MADKITIHDIQTKLDKLDYSRFERDFQGVEHQVKAVYWNCVACDIHQNAKLYDNSGYYQKFAVRLHESFMGCFYKAHELHQYLLSRFEGFHKVYRYEEPHTSTWERWKNNLDIEQAEHLQFILRSIKEHVDYSELVKNNPVTDKVSLVQFDTYQEYLSQRPYNLFLLHLKHSNFSNLPQAPIDIVLPYVIDAIFISTLQGHAKSFLKARTIKFILNKVDTLFNIEGNQINAFKKAKPKEAVTSFLNDFPEYHQLTDPQIAHLVRLSYKNENGETLKIDSIRSVLKKLRSH